MVDRIGSIWFWHDLIRFYGCGMENDDDENVGGDDTNMHSQPNYPNFSSYFMTNGDMEALCFVIV